ncbi:unnamed protein product [Hyaloperonospora brassicae]|uniref:RxLR effector candidate protein n=1 Tax=Hyaloperonospora brassicae TaxID=162125 RepID=A0AAV0UN02_HYABA|nr:unnamed protein product [Hyaloperonospora brassicae]
MRPSVSLLLCTTVYFASVHSEAPDSTPTASTRPGSLNITRPTSSRRIPSSTAGQAEERSPFVERVLKLIRPIRLVDSQAIHLESLREMTPMEDAFMQLCLNERGKSLFQEPKFLVWAAHLNDFNSKFPDKKESILLILTQHYNPDDLAKMIEEAKMVEVAKRQSRHEPQVKKSPAEILFTNLQKKQMKQWKAAGISEGAIFGMFKLHVADHVNHLTFRIWLRYASRHCLLTKEELFEVLCRRYFDETLSWLLAAAKQDEFTSRLANDLQTMLTDRWLEKRVPPQDVFKLLMLDTDVAKVYDHPERRTWEVYARNYHQYLGSEYKAWVDVLKSCYGEEALSSMIVQLIRGESEEGKEWARQLQAVLVYQWFVEKKTPKFVHDKLEVEGLVNFYAIEELVAKAWSRKHS